VFARRHCLLSLFAIVVTCVAGCSSQPVAPDPPPAGPTRIGRTVAVTLPSLDGDELDLATLRGKPVVVHFSTTGSLAAQADIEELRRVRSARRDLHVVEVALDPSQPRLIRAWANASAIDWLVLLPTPGLVGGSSEFGPIHVVPTTFLLDGDGRIVWGREGGLPRGALVRVLAELDARGGRS
jgi:cytochrome c biogenesis protein CcmG, thiol:disulfide interchange protein DsbE